VFGAMMTLPTMQALSPSIQPVQSICVKKSMRDGSSVLLTQWAELDRKFSEFRELIPFEGNDMNVTIYKKVISDLQLDWEELTKNLTSYWTMNDIIRECCRDLVLRLFFGL
jgi:hypothetical protein